MSSHALFIIMFMSCSIIFHCYVRMWVCNRSALLVSLTGFTKKQKRQMFLCLLVFPSIDVLRVVGCLCALARKDSMFFWPGIICRRFTRGGPLTFLGGQLYRWNLYQFTGTCITFFDASLEHEASAQHLGYNGQNPWHLSIGDGEQPSVYVRLILLIPHIDRTRICPQSMVFDFPFVSCVSWAREFFFSCHFVFQWGKDTFTPIGALITMALDVKGYFKAEDQGSWANVTAQGWQNGLLGRILNILPEKITCVIISYDAFYVYRRFLQVV